MKAQQTRPKTWRLPRVERESIKSVDDFWQAAADMANFLKYPDIVSYQIDDKYSLYAHYHYIDNYEGSEISNYSIYFQDQYSCPIKTWYKEGHVTDKWVQQVRRWAENYANKEGIILK